MARRLWSGKVETKWQPRPGLFREDARTIAHEVLDGHGGDLASSVASINFYINRAGSNLSPRDRARLLMARRIVQRLGRPRDAAALKRPVRLAANPQQRGESGDEYLRRLQRDASRGDASAEQEFQLVQRRYLAPPVPTCEGCDAPLNPVEAVRWSVCMGCTRARHRAVISGKCSCGRKRRHRVVHQSGRTWTACDRCLGRIAERSNPSELSRDVGECEACGEPAIIGVGRDPRVDVILCPECADSFPADDVESEDEERKAARWRSRQRRNSASACGCSSCNCTGRCSCECCCERVEVLCQCGWGSLSMRIIDVPEDCPLCGAEVGTREEWIED